MKSSSKHPPPNEPPPGVGLAPAPERRWRARLIQAYALLAALAFGALAFLAVTFGHFDLDVRVSGAVQSFRPAWFDQLMRFVSVFGYNPGAWITVSVPTGLLLGLRLRWEALVTALAGAISGLLGGLAKLAVARPRPAEELVDVLRDLPGFGFPSGHVVFYSGFFGFLFFLVFTLMPAGFWRSALLAVLGTLVALVGLSRVYLGVHWASDALAGYLLGSLVMLAFIRIYRMGAGRAEPA
jgi:membrane-associated phospholipid phosphatase